MSAAQSIFAGITLASFPFQRSSCIILHTVTLSSRLVHAIILCIQSPGSIHRTAPPAIHAVLHHAKLIYDRST